MISATITHVLEGVPNIEAYPDAREASWLRFCS
jgi:hypothetical protein